MSGTTAVMADPHDIVGAVGLAGLELLIEMTRGLPLKFFFSLPVSSLPFPEFEGEDVVPLAVMESYLARDEILALSEVTPWIRLTSADGDLLAKFELGKRWGKSRDNSGFVTAFLTGFGAKVGGLAASIAHELHKPMVIGCREDDMVAALQRVRELGGGMVLVHEGQVLAEIPLPIGGMMSAGSLEDVAAQMGAMKDVLREMGCPLEDPIFTLGFLSFSALPWIRLTPSGLLDVKKREILWR